MSFSDETLMAFADGELDESTRRLVEQAMRQDPEVAAKVARHKALRSKVFGAFAHTLDEPVPAHLKQATQPSKVVRLDAVRAARREALARRRWSWPEWGALAATLVVGVLAGVFGLKGVQGEPQLATVVGKDGALVAQGRLAQALSQQLASAPAADSGIRMGVSFVARDGAYCRSFMLGAAGGLACRSGAEWKVPVMAETAGGVSGAYRQAGGELPAVVLEAIDQRIAGQALDASAEQAAVQQGWKR